MNLEYRHLSKFLMLPACVPAYLGCYNKASTNRIKPTARKTPWFTFRQGSAGAAEHRGTGDIINLADTYQFEQWEKPVGESIRTDQDDLVPIAYSRRLRIPSLIDHPEERQ